MRKYINEVKAERKQVIEDEKDYIYGQKPVTYFPYTHGDSLEMARRKIYQELNSDMKLEYAKIELDERRRLGDKVYEDIYCRVNANGRNEIDESLYPQGDAKTKLLSEQFQ